MSKYFQKTDSTPLLLLVQSPSAFADAFSFGVVVVINCTVKNVL